MISMDMNKQLIAILCGSPISHNMETVLVNLGRMLADEFELHLLVGQAEVPARLEQNYRIKRFSVGGLDPASLRYAHNACSGYLRQKTPDVMMNIALPHTLGFVLARFGKKHRIPVVIRMTGDTFGEAHLVKGRIKRLKKWFLHEKLGLSAYRNATVIVPVGDNLKKSLLKKGLSEENILTIPQPFDTSRFQPVPVEKKTELKSQLGLRTDKKTILFAGRLSWLKGADRLLAIAEGVCQRSSEYQFCFAGDGDFESVFNELFTSDQVKLVGNISNEKIADYYKAADLFIFPSRTEGLPNTILEAIACGLPIMASSVGEVPHYVSNRSEKVEEYVDFILGGKWQSENVPKWFAWDYQKSVYHRLFKRVIQEHRCGD